LKRCGCFIDRIVSEGLYPPPIRPAVAPDHIQEARAISCLMSSTRHAVMRGPSFTGLGYRPDLTPAHHVERLTGIGPCGARIEVSLRNPVAGSSC
jgi:hypothetical protein